MGGAIWSLYTDSMARVACKLLILSSVLSLGLGACGKTTSQGLDDQETEDSYQVRGVISFLSNALMPSAYAAPSLAVKNCSKDCSSEGTAGCAYLQATDEDGEGVEPSLCSVNLESLDSGKYFYDFKIANRSSLPEFDNPLIIKAYLPTGAYRESLFVPQANEKLKELDVDASSFLQSQVLRDLRRSNGAVAENSPLAAGVIELLGTLGFKSNNGTLSFNDLSSMLSNPSRRNSLSEFISTYGAQLRDLAEAGDLSLTKSQILAAIGASSTEVDSIVVPSPSLPGLPTIGALTGLVPTLPVFVPALPGTGGPISVSPGTLAAPVVNSTATLTLTNTYTNTNTGITPLPPVWNSPSPNWTPSCVNGPCP